MICLSRLTKKEENKMFSSIFGFFAKSVFQAVVNVVVGIVAVGFLIKQSISYIDWGSAFGNNIVEGEVI